MRPATAALAATALLFACHPAPARGGSILPQIETAQVNAALEEVPTSPLAKHYVEVAPGIFIAVHGEKERRQVRFARWIEGLRGDRAEVYLVEGFPRHRHYENFGGRRTEHWTYPDRDVTYIFSGNTVLEVRGN